MHIPSQTFRRQPTTDNRTTMRTLLILTAIFCMALFPFGLTGQGEARAETPERVAAGKESCLSPLRGSWSGKLPRLPCDGGGGVAGGIWGLRCLQSSCAFRSASGCAVRFIDATEFNPISAMPPFGKHGILTAEEIELVLDFLYTL